MTEKKKKGTTKAADKSKAEEFTAPEPEAPDTPPQEEPAVEATPSTEPTAPTPPPLPQDQEPSSEARTWGMLAHLLTLSGLIIPFGNILAPLIIYLIKRDEFPFVDDQSKEALNFQITVTIAAIICVPLIFICIGIPLLILVMLASIIFAIIGGVKAYDGKLYRYPWALRLIK